MQYYSTRDTDLRLSAAQAIIQGLSQDGGLMTPETIPQLSSDFLERLSGCSYPERAAYVMHLYLPDYTEEELLQYAQRAYGLDRFDTESAAPVVPLEENTSVLELWHGPTSAFKDMALQMLPQLLSAARQKSGDSRKACILAATSGDTGKAAMEGFADLPQTKILVFYPEHGVSAIQEAQMVTQTGANVGVCAVKGNFDDAQTGVKRIFSDETMRHALQERGYFLSSANSINWGRILPQIVYYISAYCDLVQAGRIERGEAIHVCVPTGNFGNILAAYYAKRMGLPIGRLICASNRNHILTDFLTTGVYDRNRPFYATMSPSMDILISSNLERFLFHLSGEDTASVKHWMQALKETGRYEIPEALRQKIGDLCWSGFCDEAETVSTIAGCYREKGYLLDPHTAVAAHVLDRYRAQTGDRSHAIVVSTASPYKFCDHVLRAIGQEPVGDGVALLDQLQAYTGCPIPRRLAELKGKKRRFSQSVEKQEMERAVLDFLQE